MTRLAVLAAIAALCVSGCKSGSNVDWSGSIVCKDGICTPTLTLSPTLAPHAQLEK